MKTVKKLFTSVLLAFALLLVAPSVIPGYSNTETVHAANVSQKTLVKGRSLGVTVKNASNLVWRSSNTSVATVSANSTGTQIVISAKAKGTAYIQYRLAGKSNYTPQYLINVATINKSSIVRSKNGYYTLTLSGVPSSQSVSWAITDSKGNVTSATSSIASLSNATSTSVKVTGKNKGTAYIRANIGGLKQIVTKVKVETPSLSKTTVGLTKGNSYTLSVNNTTQTVTWSSSNTSVATVTSAGKVTAKSAGTAKIYAVVGGAKYTCNVTVKNPMTAANYMKNLKTKISKSSKVNSSGDHYISYLTRTTDGTRTYNYYVIYEKSKDRLRFRFTHNDNTSKRSATINMYIANPSKTYQTTPSLSIVTPKGVSFKTKRLFSDYRKYSNSTTYTYTITKHNLKSITSAHKQAMQELSNGYMQKAMEGWNTLLSKNGFTMKKIGFTKF